jgi:hypothetical protein
VLGADGAVGQPGSMVLGGLIEQDGVAKFDKSFNEAAICSRKA